MTGCVLMGVLAVHTWAKRDPPELSRITGRRLSCSAALTRHRPARVIHVTNPIIEAACQSGCSDRLCAGNGSRSVLYVAQVKP